MRARSGTLASVRSTARSACLRSNWAIALALSALLTILIRKREVLFFSTAASLAANSASSLLGAPTAKISVSEWCTSARPPQTVASDNSRVSTT
ncbi:putative membrane protein [Bradyrhizobium sp. LM4.3]